MKIRLFYLDETDAAFKYSKTPPTPDRDPVIIWIPKSVVEHRSKTGIEHIITVADWFAQKEGL